MPALWGTGARLRIHWHTRYITRLRFSCFFNCVRVQVPCLVFCCRFGYSPQGIYWRCSNRPVGWRVRPCFYRRHYSIITRSKRKVHDQWAFRPCPTTIGRSSTYQRMVGDKIQAERQSGSRLLRGTSGQNQVRDTIHWRSYWYFPIQNPNFHAAVEQIFRSDISVFIFFILRRQKKANKVKTQHINTSQRMEIELSKNTRYTRGKTSSSATLMVEYFSSVPFTSYYGWH